MDIKGRSTVELFPSLLTCVKQIPTRNLYFLLMCMHVSQGSKGKIDADVDLWGAKGIPNVHCTAKHLAADIKASQDLLQDTPKITLELCYLQLENVLQRMFHHCKNMRKRLTGAYFLEKKIEKMQDSNPNKKDSYQWSLGHIYTLSTELENCVNRALNINLDICREMICINRNLHCFSDSKFVQLHKQSNFFGLLPSEYVLQHMDLELEHQTVFYSQ